MMDLPVDPALLQALVLEQRELLAELRRQLAERLAEIEELRSQLAVLKRQNFGRRSEQVKRQIQQMEERVCELTEEYIQRLAPRDLDVPAALRQSPARKPLPAELPREVKQLAPKEKVCPDCGGELKPLGEEVSEPLELIQSAFKVIQWVKQKQACGHCDRIVQAPAPRRPIERSIAGSGLLARVVMSKYGEHTLLYRQSEIYARQGVELSRATLAHWVGAVSDLVQPLVTEIQCSVLQGKKLHVDDTPVQVQEPGKGKTRRARLWAHVLDNRNAGSIEAPAVWFTYTPDRQGVHPQSHLSDYRGILQADAYPGFDKLYQAGTIQEAACMAPARRKIYDTHLRHPSPNSQEALKRIGELYDIEAQIRGQSVESRLKVRQEKSGPLLEELGEWLRERVRTLSQHAELAKAFNYLLNHWSALNVFCHNGLVEIDNNIAENALRAVALGRKNYRFMGSDRGGGFAANL